MIILVTSSIFLDGCIITNLQRLKDTGIDDSEWDHPDFVKERKKLEDRVRQEIMRDRELTRK
jgi:hypothetical protein